jgi:hypothetical protein
MFSPCSAKRRASEKDLPVKEGIFTHLEWDDLSLVLLLIEFSSFLCVVDFNHMRPN